METGNIISKKEGLTIVRLEGSPYEIGFQHGGLLKNEINWFYSNAFKKTQEKEGKMVGGLAFLLLKMFVKVLARRIPEEFKEEMKGIAKGAKVPYNFILMANFIEELDAIYQWFINPFCTAFVKKNKEEIIWGRNMDYTSYIDVLPSLNTLFIYRPENGFPFVSLGWPCSIAAYTAFSKNLELILLASPVKKKRFGKISDGMLTRQIIQYNKTIEEAEEKILPGLLSAGRSIVLVSKDNAEVVEITSSKKAVRHLQPQNFLTATNMYQTKEMQEEQPVYYPKPKKTDLPDNMFSRAGDIQDENKLRKACLAGEIDVERAKEILDNVSSPGTVQSIISCPAKKEFWLAKSPQAPVTKGEWIKFNLRDFLN